MLKRVHLHFSIYLLIRRDFGCVWMVSVVFIKLWRRGGPAHTGASVASVTTFVFGWFNCRHTWKHITPGDEMPVLENST